MPRSTHKLRSIIALLLLTLGGGCSVFQKNPAPLTPPSLNPGIRQFVGTPLTGPGEARKLPAGDLSQALRVDVEWFAVESTNLDALPPLDSRARMILAPATTEPVMAAGKLTRGVRFGADQAANDFERDLRGGKFGKNAAIGSQSALNLAGATLEFSSATVGAGEGNSRRLSVLLYRDPAMSATAATTNTTPATTSAATQPAGAAIAVRISERRAETAIVDDVPLSDGTSIAIATPMEFGQTPWRSLVAIVHVRAAGDEAADKDALAKLQSELQPATTQSSEKVPAKNWSTFESAIAALSTPGGARSPLLFLATGSGATLASDLVLIADDATLTRLAEDVTKYAKSDNASLEAQNLAWQLDASALNLLADALAKPEPPAELASLASIYAGEVGRHPDSLAEVAKSAGNAKDLSNRLFGENLIFLEDNSPASRIRAFDWLRSRGAAPSGFDPLGEPKARRAALDKAMNEGGVK